MSILAVENERNFSDAMKIILWSLLCGCASMWWAIAARRFALLRRLGKEVYRVNSELDDKTINDKTMKR